MTECPLCREALHECSCFRNGDGFGYFDIDCYIQGYGCSYVSGSGKGNGDDNSDSDEVPHD